ncbi:MAG: PilC/PilY family type IV pilus protein [Smithella sp.]|jgi:Tfp pilus tip-associated adhesin PilY1
MLNKKSFISLLMTLMILAFLSFSTEVFADDDEEPAGDESASFISVAPDALIVLDLSGSMMFNPPGADDYIYGSSTSCTADTTNCVSSGGGGGYWGWGYHTDPWGGWGTTPGGSTGDCSDGFCKSSITNCTINCSRLAIAKRALFNVLDNDDNGIINSADSDSMGIRIGYMRFYNCSGDDTGGSYSSGCNKLVTTISTLGSETGTSYSKTYCGSSSSCSSSVSSCSTGSCVIGESATGGTPLATSLNEAKLYLDTHKASDSSKACRQKFVILVTDGADTFACSGSGSECQEHMYKRRRAVVATTRALYNAGYKVFVIGFGSTMPSYLKNTLNWMAYHGGTDNPYLTNAGSTSGYSISSGSTYPSGISSCSADTYETASCYSAGSTSSTARFKATNNDPGYLDLSGYAFLAGDADELTDALKNAMNTIRSATYSFTQSSIQAVRTIDENYVYEASFEPLNSDPFWIGNLKRFPINDDGTITAAADWNAGTVLQSDSSRNILTTNPSVTTGVLKSFTTGNVTNANLDVTTDAERTEIVNFITNGELDSTYTYYGWKLGDIFHTSPLSIATPNTNFYDTWDSTTYDAYYDPEYYAEHKTCKPCTDCSKSFTEFLCTHVRKADEGTRIVIVGANDGQMHAFKALDGSEVWSFIPPNLLPQLKNIVHSSHPTALAHEYFVDGPLSAAEIWLGTSGTIGSTAKSQNDWHTYLVMGEGRGGIATLWSASNTCSSTFSPAYKNYSGTLFVPYGYYCGYYAFDISDTTANPVFKWRLGGNSAISSTSDGTAAYLGQAWSKMYLGRVRINNAEKWVGFIGAGYSGTNCSGATTCDTRGKGFFAVDLSDGTILWTFTHANNASMDFDLVAGPTVVDYDDDGFLDTAYIGDMGGNIWRFKFCLAGDGTTCGTSSWSGSLLLANSSTTDGNKAIYTIPSVSFDVNYNLWVYVGTGNKTDPTSTSSAGRILGVRDSDRSASYSLSNLTGGNGWYFTLTGTGEKILAEAVVYDKKLYFTSYLPASSSDGCSIAGTAKLYILDYLTGSVLYSASIGTGIPSAPVISFNPTTKEKDVYVSMSEEASSSTKVHTVKITDPTPDYTPEKTLRYWKDMRVQ